MPTPASKVIDTLASLPTAADRLEWITTRYAKGDTVLKNLDAEQLAPLLDVDLDFGGEWEYSQVPWQEPEAADLDDEEASVVVGYVATRGATSERLEELERRAEEIDQGRSKRVIARLGLTPEEVSMALEGRRESILEGDAGWNHLAELTLTGTNGWSLVFSLEYNDESKDASFRVVPPTC